MKCAFPLLLLLSLNVTAQQPASGMRRVSPEAQARFDSARARYFPPGTDGGVGDSELKEYEAIIARHKSRPDAPYSEWARTVSPATQEQLRGLFARISRKQQLAQQTVFVRVDPPKPRRALTDTELTAFRDSTHFNVVLDGKPAPNAVLEGWKSGDFATYEVQPNLLRRAGSSYFTQRVSLQSNGYYEAAQKRYEQNKDKYLMVNTMLRGEVVQRPAN